MDDNGIYLKKNISSWGKYEKMMKTIEEPRFWTKILRSPILVKSSKSGAQGLEKPKLALEKG